LLFSLAPSPRHLIRGLVGLVHEKDYSYYINVLFQR
jgi:hypothetical protein